MDILSKVTDEMQGILIQSKHKLLVRGEITTKTQRKHDHSF